MILVCVNDLLHLAFTAHEYSAAIVDVLWDDFEHAAHIAVDCETASY